MSKELKCDFCSLKRIEWAFRTRVFVYGIDMQRNLHLDDGRWAACSICHDLVVERRQEALLKRSYESFLYLHPEALMVPQRCRNDLKNKIRAFHQKFFANLLPDPPEKL